MKKTSPVWPSGEFWGVSVSDGGNPAELGGTKTFALCHLQGRCDQATWEKPTHASVTSWKWLPGLPGPHAFMKDQLVTQCYLFLSTLNTELAWISGWAPVLVCFRMRSLFLTRSHSAYSSPINMLSGTTTLSHLDYSLSHSFSAVVFLDLCLFKKNSALAL